MYKTHKEKIVATIEARMTSSRLPGKVLMPLAGKPALERLIERLKRSKYLDGIIVATTTNDADDPIEELTKKTGVNCYRGSEMDVLGRVLDAARSVNADVIVEITGDCPLMDHRLVDRGIEEYFSRDVDYVANILKRGYSDGFDVQVFSTKTLAKTSALTKDPIDRVHVSYYIYSHPEQFKLFNWEPAEDCFLPEGRVTLDEKEDYELINKIFEKLLPQKEDFSAEDIVKLLKSNPKLMRINEHIRQKNIQEG